MSSAEGLCIKVDVEYVRGTIETVQLAIEIADEVAVADIESYCAFERIGGPTGGFTWYDTTVAQDGSGEPTSVAKVLRYLDLRGLVKHHPQQQHLVRFL